MAAPDPLGLAGPETAGGDGLTDQPGGELLEAPPPGGVDRVPGPSRSSGSQFGGVGHQDRVPGDDAILSLGAEGVPGTRCQMPDMCFT